MKVLFLSHFVPYPPHGGSLQRSFNLLREISRDNEVHLLALNQKAILPREGDIDEAIQVLNSYCKYVRVFKIPTDYNRARWYLTLFTNLFSLAPYSVWKFKSNEMSVAIADLVQNTKFDLVHFDTIDLAQYFDLIPGLPAVMNHHNVESELLGRRARSDMNPLVRMYLSLQAWKLKRYERNNVRRFSMNVVVSTSDRKILERDSPGAKVRVVANGTDVDYFKPCSVAGSKELVFAGGMNWYPNRDAMIYFCNEIYPLIKQKVPDVAMNLIGGSVPNKVLNLSKRDSSIKIHGYVKDVRPLINRSAVYVVPIRVGGGTRLKILDAFACGKALVSTSVGCEGIDVTPGENILIGDNSQQFADEVIRLLNDDALRMKLESNARKLVEEKYSWQVIGSALKEAYRSVLK